MRGTNISLAKAEKALQQVAAWLGRQGYGTWRACGKCAGCTIEPEQSMSKQFTYNCSSPKLGPAPTGSAAAASGDGPELRMDWDWPGKPTPTIILEGGPDGWAYTAAGIVKVPGVFAEPYAGYALCLYPA